MPWADGRRARLWAWLALPYFLHQARAPWRVVKVSLFSIHNEGLRVDTSPAISILGTPGLLLIMASCHSAGPLSWLGAMCFRGTGQCGPHPPPRWGPSPGWGAEPSQGEAAPGDQLSSFCRAEAAPAQEVPRPGPHSFRALAASCLHQRPGPSRRTQGSVPAREFTGEIAATPRYWPQQD